MVYDETSTPGRPLEMFSIANELDELGAPLAGVTPRAQLHQVKDIARQQRNAVDGLDGDELAHRGVAGIHQRRGLRSP